MKIYCISEGELHLAENIRDGKTKTVSCRRIDEYLETLRKMKQRDEWKTTGKGAKFMGVEQREYGDETAHGEPLLRAAASCGEKLIYSTFIDGMGGMYFKSTDSEEEQYIFANQELDLTGISCRDGKCAVSGAVGYHEKHIYTADLENGRLNQITEGFTCETHPYISACDSAIIYYTAMGYARDQHGNIMEKSPCSIDCYNGHTGVLETVVSDGGYDYIKPADDKDGNLYYIRRKYELTRKKNNLLLDILLFPVRIIKAIGGFLSVFSMAFGGEPLRTGGKNPAKQRTADERKIFVEGNIINAQKQSGENPDGGIIPSGWVLIKRDTDGNEQIIKKGVMDYRIADSGEIIYSDGSHLGIIHADGKDSRICKIKLANSIAVI